MKQMLKGKCLNYPGNRRDGSVINSGHCFGEDLSLVPSTCPGSSQLSVCHSSSRGSNADSWPLCVYSHGHVTGRYTDICII